MSDESQPLIEAAPFLDRTIRLFLSEEGSLQAETWIVAVARMAGTLILQDQLPEGAAPAGTVLLADGVNREGPRLVRLMLLTLAHLGSPLEEAEIEAPEAGTAAVPLTLAATRERLEPLVLACGRSHGLGLGETADALMISTALALHTCSELVPLPLGAGLAVAGLVEGARTMPSGSPSPANA